MTLPAADSPLSGVRVLDLTRVIAGPVCTRFLAAYGAQVLRIDPPGFAEVPALLPEVTPGKRCAALDLRTAHGRDRFLELVRQAHVLVGGLRDGALARLGLGVPELCAVNPALITARLTAYGWSGPWRGRRGFDSLVQMSCGIAHADPASADPVSTDPGSADPGAAPSPLPAQALDHATGYLLAAAVCRAMTRQLRTGVPSDIGTSLMTTANDLLNLPTVAGAVPADPGGPDAFFEDVDTTWGPGSGCPAASTASPRPGPSTPDRSAGTRRRSTDPAAPCGPPPRPRNAVGSRPPQGGGHWRGCPAHRRGIRAQSAGKLQS